MHGRIVQYLSTNERGAVINASKILFDFSKDSWHDDRILPVVGMLVEFRCNEKTGRITDCKASKYQIFGANSLVKEKHFWSCDSDAKLEEIERDLRSEAVIKIFKETDYTKVESIPLTLNVQDSIKKYFVNEFLAVSFLNDLYLPETCVVFDYQITKRFLTKTLDTLLFNDKTIPKDYFSDELGMIVRLDRAYTDYSKYRNNNLHRIFEESFLQYQHHYHALKRAIVEMHDGKKYHARKMEFYDSDLLLLDKKIKEKVKLQENLEKKKKILGDLEKAAKEREFCQSQEVYLTKIKEEFETKYYGEFCKEYNSVYKRLFRKIKSGLDLCATLLDNKIHKRAINSQALKKTYFKNIENDRSPSSLSFMERYLEHLNKDHLNERDKILYAYVQKLIKENFKYYLIVSEREKESEEVKFDILSQGKYISAKIVQKQLQYFSLLKERTYDAIYVDDTLSWGTIEKLIEDAKDLKINADVKFIRITKRGEYERVV